MPVCRVLGPALVLMTPMGRRQENSFLLLSGLVPNITCKGNDGVAWFWAESRTGIFYQQPLIRRESKSTGVYVGLRAKKPVLRWVCQCSWYFLRKEHAKPSVRRGCCDSERLFQHYTINCEMGESGPFFNCRVYCAPSMSLEVSFFSVHRAMFMYTA